MAAKKPPKKRLVNFRATEAQIAAWKRAAARDRRTLTAWVTLILDGAAR